MDQLLLFLSGGPTQKRGRRGEKKELKPGGALQSHRAGGKMKMLKSRRKRPKSVNLKTNLPDQELKNRIAILETELRHEKNRGQVILNFQC